MSIRILLADDHAIVRHGLSRSFQQEEGFEVIGQANDGHSTVELARELSPDIVVMDIAMPDLNGIEATRQIAKRSPGVDVIGLSMHSGNKYVREMFRAGAKRYCQMSWMGFFSTQGWNRSADCIDLFIHPTSKARVSLHYLASAGG